jgi:DNA-binding response OmpR family regulator
MAAAALIVDDERDIRELLVLTLGRMGLRVDTAANLTSRRASCWPATLRPVLHRHAPARRQRPSTWSARSPRYPTPRWR